MWQSILFGLFLIVISILMTARQIRANEDLQKEDLGEDDRDFFRSQHRRRVQATGMIGILGVIIIVGIWIDGIVLPAVYWSLAVLLVLWMTLMAVGDLVSTRHHYAQLRNRQLIEHARLQAELDRLRRPEGNGRQEAEE